MLNGGPRKSIFKQIPANHMDMSLDSGPSGITDQKNKQKTVDAGKVETKATSVNPSFEALFPNFQDFEKIFN